MWDQILVIICRLVRSGKRSPKKTSEKKFREHTSKTKSVTEVRSVTFKMLKYRK